MNELYFYTTLIVLGLFVLSYLAWVLRMAKRLMRIALVLFAAITFSLYWQWGGGKQFHEFNQRQAHNREVKKTLASFSGPQQVIQRLKEKLANEPNSAQGWYLLGRLYMTQNELSQAIKSFTKSLALKEELKTQLNLVQAIYLQNNPARLKQADRVITKILAKDPMQPDALSLSAIAAYKKKNYALAISQWQKLLTLLPDGGKEQKAVREAILQAQQHSKNKENNNG